MYAGFIAAVWLFVGSEAGGAAAAIVYTLIETAKLNGIDPRAWIAHILECAHDRKTTQPHELIPWNRNTQAAIK